MEKVTIKEIAKKLNLSVATVSRAINPICREAAYLRIGLDPVRALKNLV